MVCGKVESYLLMRSALTVVLPDISQDMVVEVTDVFPTTKLPVMFVLAAICIVGALIVPELFMFPLMSMGYCGVGLLIPTFPVA